jgi:hypothetical protein
MFRIMYFRIGINSTYQKCRLHYVLLSERSNETIVRNSKQKEVWKRFVCTVQLKKNQKKFGRDCVQSKNKKKIGKDCVKTKKMLCLIIDILLH